MLALAQFSASALLLVAAGAEPVAAVIDSPLSLASASSGEQQYPALSETLQDVGAKLEAAYASHDADLSKALSKHMQDDKAALEASIVKTMSSAQQAFTETRAERNVRNRSQGASFLQRRFQLEGDGAVKVSVAGVSQPGKSIGKRVGRLAQKWYVSSDKVFAIAARGFDQIADGLQRQLQAALQHASDARLRNALQGKGLAAAAFMVQSTSAGGSADVELSADTAAWPLASDLVLDMQERSSHYMVESCAKIADSFASLAKADTNAIRAALAGSAV